MSREKKSSYEAAGVKSTHESSDSGLGKLTDILRETFPAAGEPGEPLLDFGYFANVVRVSDEIGLAITTDGVGTKILIAEQMGKYDTIGIDCVAMNVNDLVCVGARPLALVDYIAVQELEDSLLTDLARGLAAGAREAGVSIPGGEIAQVHEMLAGAPGKNGFDLVAAAVGTVHPDKVLVGQNIEEGDVVLGFPSSGLHSNGYTLARRVLLDEGGYELDQHIGELGRTLGDELLEPTRIYVKAALEMMAVPGAVRALIHMTGDGMLNLQRVQADVGFVIENWPTPPPIFDLIEKTGKISQAEMFQVFNMGVGFCAVVAQDRIDEVRSLVSESFDGVIEMGVAKTDADRVVDIPSLGLVGRVGTIHSSR